MKQGWAVLLFLIPLMAGCMGSDEAEPPMENAGVEARPAATFAGGRVDVDVTVPIILVGFPEGTAAELEEALPEMRPDANTYNNARLLAGNLLNGGSGARANPMNPTAVYEYHEPASVTSAVQAALPDLMIESNLVDANGMDDVLFQAIMDAGIELDANNPGFVLLHLGRDDHAYRLTYPTGYIEGVRSFGERYPYTALDVSARVDPYVGTANDFNSPLPASGSVEALANAVERATWYRTLQGPIYPQSTMACHAVTLMVVYRTTSISQSLPGYSKAEDLLDADYLTTAWESLLGEGRVFVDPLFIALPVDDPPLEAVLREGQNEALRAYMYETWDSYHVAHPGCEAYLSVFLLGDAADSGVSGIAMYDVNENRRISMSWMNDLTIFEEQDGIAGPVFYESDPSRNRTDWINFLFSHETGHLFGQRHPHDVSANDAPAGGMTFAAIWSAMSYQQDGKIPEFGAVDQANYWRNRAGFIAEAAAEMGAEGTSEFDQALHLMGQYEWKQAGDLLLPLVNI